MTFNKKDYFKIKLFPNGMECPKCHGAHFHPIATVLPNANAQANDKNGLNGKVNLWVARSECLDCDGILDWTFHPDYVNGYGNEFRSIVNWGGNFGALYAYKDFPKSKAKHTDKK